MIVKVYILLVLIIITILVNSEGDIDPKLFQSNVIGDEKLWLVEFYSYKCGSCQEFAPTWKKVTESVKSISTGKINVDNPEVVVI